MVSREWKNRNSSYNFVPHSSIPYVLTKGKVMPRQVSAFGFAAVARKADCQLVTAKFGAMESGQQGLFACAGAFFLLS